MTLILAILGAIPAIYGIIVFVQKIFYKPPAKKVEQIIAEVEAALNNAQKTGNTSDIEKLINN